MVTADLRTIIFVVPLPYFVLRAIGLLGCRSQTRVVVSL